MATPLRGQQAGVYCPDSAHRNDRRAHRRLGKYGRRERQCGRPPRLRGKRRQTQQLGSKPARGQMPEKSQATNTRHLATILLRMETER